MLAPVLTTLETNWGLETCAYETEYHTSHDNLLKRVYEQTKTINPLYETSRPSSVKKHRGTVDRVVKSEVSGRTDTQRTLQTRRVQVKHDYWTSVLPFLEEEDDIPVVPLCVV